MIVVLPFANGRIAPLFDVARHVLIVGHNDGREIWRKDARIDSFNLYERVQFLVRHDARALLCEAISAPLERLVVMEGIRVIHDTCGPVESVLLAYISGQLTEDKFVMPGCGGHRRPLLPCIESCHSENMKEQQHAFV